MKTFRLIDGNKVEFRIPKGSRVEVRKAEEKDRSLERLIASGMPAPLHHPQHDYDVIEIHKPL